MLMSLKSMGEEVERMEINGDELHWAIVSHSEGSLSSLSPRPGADSAIC